MPESPSARSPPDLTRSLVGALVIGALIVAAFWIVRPFLAAAVWATTIAVVTWPVLLRIQALLWRSRRLAIIVMVLILLLAFVIPLLLAAGTIVANASEIAERARDIASFRRPLAPSWIADLPYLGPRLATLWKDAAAGGLEGVWTQLAPYVGSLTAWFVARAGNLGYLAVQFLLTLVLTGFMYAHGEWASATVLRFGRRLGGPGGEDLVRLAGQSIRGIALGVGLTAAIQSVLGGIGLAVAGVPFAGLLTALLFMLCVVQVGMLVVLIPAVVWVYWSGGAVAGTALLVWSMVASLMDTVLRPVLVRRSADLPFLLIFIGVIGGLVAFGLLGIFVGPVILAVAYTVLLTWLAPAAGARQASPIA